MIPTFDSTTGWLSPGRYDVDADYIRATFVTGRGDTRREEIWSAFELLLIAVKELIPSGFLLVAGTFVSHQPGPCDTPSIAIVPHDPSTLTVWTDAEEDRFLRYQSIQDVLVGSLGGQYFEVLHPLSGLVEVIYCNPVDAADVALWMGAVTESTGAIMVGVRGVLEVEW